MVVAIFLLCEIERAGHIRGRAKAAKWRRETGSTRVSAALDIDTCTRAYLPLQNVRVEWWEKGKEKREARRLLASSKPSAPNSADGSRARSGEGRASRSRARPQSAELHPPQALLL